MFFIENITHILAKWVFLFLLMGIDYLYELQTRRCPYGKSHYYRKEGKSGTNCF